MEVLHIIPVAGNHIIPLAEALQRYDTENKHTFMVTVPLQTVLRQNAELLRIRDLRFVPVYRRHSGIRKLRYLLECAKNADRVVWHSLSTNGGYTPFFLYAFRSVLKKSTWIPAEGEIGNYMTVANKFLNRFVRRINLYVQRNVACIGLTVPSDEEALKAFDIRKPKTSILRYVMQPSQYAALSLCLAQPAPSVKKAAVYVQLGLNSQLENHHRHLIESLGSVPERERVCAFFPFCYTMRAVPYRGGTKVYMNRIKAAAQTLECRTVFLNKTVQEEEYCKLLSQMDVVLLGNSASCQTGMLLCLLALGKRVFMPEASPLYRYLNDSGANILPLEALSDIESLDSVLQMPGSHLPEPLMQSFAPEQIVAQWADWCRFTIN